MSQPEKPGPDVAATPAAGATSKPVASILAQIDEPPPRAAADTLAGDDVAGHGDDGRDAAPTPAPDLETLARDHPQVRELLYELQRARDAATGVPGDDIVATGDTGRDTAPTPAPDPESPEPASEEIENGDGAPTPGSEPDPRADAAAEGDADDTLAGDDVAGPGDDGRDTAPTPVPDLETLARDHPHVRELLYELHRARDTALGVPGDDDVVAPEEVETGDNAPAPTPGPEPDPRPEPALEPRADADAEADDVVAPDDAGRDAAPTPAPDPETPGPDPDRGPENAETPEKTESDADAPVPAPGSRPTPRPGPRSEPALQPRVDAVAAEDIREALRHHAADFTRWREVERRGRRLAGSLALALAAPLCLLCGLLLGLLLQTHFAVLTVPDPTGGWKDHVWRLHGQALVDCTARARAAGTAVTCPITIEAP